jgi:hypothetical protein
MCEENVKNPMDLNGDGKVSLGVNMNLSAANGRLYVLTHETLKAPVGTWTKVGAQLDAGGTVVIADCQRDALPGLICAHDQELPRKGGLGDARSLHHHLADGRVQHLFFQNLEHNILLFAKTNKYNYFCVTMKAILIYSGGLDSTTLLYEYKDSIALALTFDYGSKHNAREIEFARENCRRLGIPHRVIELAFIRDFYKSDLLLTGPTAVVEEGEF